MESSINPGNTVLTVPPRAHPLVLAAATSVTLLGLAGTAYFAGWLPGPAARDLTAERQIVAVAQPTSATASAPNADIAPRARVDVQAVAKPVIRASATPRQVSRRDRAVAPVAAAEAPRSPEVAVVPAPTSVASTTPLICRECGYIESVQEVPVEPKGSGTGAVAGGIVGGILGNQMGRGTTRDIATVLGALGGAYAGNHIEKSMKDSKRYDVMVRFDDGSRRTFSADTPPAWRAGDRVKLQNGTLISGGKSSIDMGTV